MSWRPIESAIVSPHRLQDLVLSNIPKKVSFAKFGRIVSHLLEVWKSVETSTKIALMFQRFCWVNSLSLSSINGRIKIFIPYLTYVQIIFYVLLKTFVRLTISQQIPSSSISRFAVL